jgi:hypothetical protein
LFSSPNVGVINHNAIGNFEIVARNGHPVPVT